MTIRIPVLLLVLGLSQATLAQTNLAGTWALQNKEHIMGPEYGNALATQITLQQQTDSLIIETISVGAEGAEVKSRQAVSTDGKPSTTSSTTTHRKYVRSMKWTPDKKGIVLTTVFYMPDNPNEVDFTRVETWTVSPDGKELNIDKKSIETRSETWQVKGVYAKK